MVALLGTRQQHLLGRTYTYDLHKPYLGTFYFSRYPSEQCGPGP